MRYIYIIDHERYGARTEFGGLEQAQAGIRDCGETFGKVVLTRIGSEIHDETGDVVGNVVRAEPWSS